MKKLTGILLALTLFVSKNTNAQSAADLFSAKEIVWYGIDYSLARFIGSEAFKNPTDIKNSFLPAWNGLVFSEPLKYDVKGAFYKDNMQYNIDMINKRNQETVKADELVINKNHSITEEDVKKSVSSYKLEEKSGVGVVFVVESYSKPEIKASVYVVVFDIATKKTLIVEKMSSVAKGVGLRNFWASTTADLLKQIKTSKYSDWKSKNK